MTSEPLISVIMPVYNAESFLDEAIHSICKQTYRKFEFLITNDGSTDNSSSIISKWEKVDPRISAIHQRNQGIVKTLNSLVQRSKGELIARFDADDISFSERLATQVSYFDKDPNLGVLGSKVKLLGNTGGTWHYRQSNLATRQLIALGNTPLCHPSIMAKRKLLIDIPYTENYPHMEDLDWFQSICERSSLNIYATEEVLLGYRLHQNNISVIHSQKQSVERQKLLARNWRSLNIEFDDKDIFCFATCLLGENSQLCPQQIRKSVDKISKQLEASFPGITKVIKHREEQFSIKREKYSCKS